MICEYFERWKEETWEYEESGYEYFDEEVNQDCYGSDEYTEEAYGITQSVQEQQVNNQYLDVTRHMSLNKQNMFMVNNNQKCENNDLFRFGGKYR